MPFNIPAPSAGAGAPEVEDGLALARFDDIVLKEHPDWAGTDQYGKEDDGSRFHFKFTLVDDDHAVVYQDGDPVELEAMTRVATGEKSNFRALLSGILTAKELAAWEASTADDPFDGSAIPGRILNVKIAHNKKGWPFIEQVIGVAKTKGGK